MIRKNKKINKKIFFIAFPVMLQMMAEYILRFTDTAFIGNYKVEGLSAINNAMMPFFMFLSFFFALSKGTTILISQFIGAKEREKASSITEQSYFFNTIISLLYFIFWILFTPQILTLIGAKGDIHSMAVNYLRIASFHFLFFGISLSDRSQLEGLGNTTPIMITTLISVFINIPLDWILIFGKFGLPQMGIEGAALATLFSQMIGSVLLTILVFKKNELGLKIRNIFIPKIKVYWQSIKLGFPNGIEFMIWTVGQNVILMLMNSVNQEYAGVFGTINLLRMLSFYIYIGIGVSAMSLVGKSIGADRWGRAYLAGNRTITISLIICLVYAVLMVIFPKQILSIFSKEPGFTEKYYHLLYISALIIFPQAINVVIGNAIRGTGNTKWMLYTQIPGTLLIVVFSYFFLHWMNLGMLGLYIAIFIDELWRSIVNFGKFSAMAKKRAFAKYQQLFFEENNLIS